MIQEKKKLHDIKHYNTSIVLLEPPYTNEVGEVDTSISHRLLSNTTKLVWV